MGGSNRLQLGFPLASKCTLLHCYNTFDSRIKSNIAWDVLHSVFRGNDGMQELRHRPGLSVQCQPPTDEQWLPVHRTNPLRFPWVILVSDMRETGDHYAGTLGSRQLVLWTCDICHNSIPNETNHWAPILSGIPMSFWRSPLSFYRTNLMALVLYSALYLHIWVVPFFCKYMPLYN